MNLACPTCPGVSRCPIAEAEAHLNELRKEKIRRELRETQWIISLHATEGDVLGPEDLRAMLLLRTRLQKLLFNDSTAELSSAAAQIAEVNLLRSGIQ